MLVFTGQGDFAALLGFLRRIKSVAGDYKNINYVGHIFKQVF